MARVSRVLSLLLFSGVLATFAFTGSAVAAVGCDLYASPSGSDLATGLLGSPLKSLPALDEALAPGQTGCLESGTYGSISSELRLDNSGTASGQITITTAPGQASKVVGLLEMEGSYTTLTGLNIDGSNNLYTGQRSGTNCAFPVSNGMEIDGQNDVFQDNDFYQSIAGLRGNGIGVGWNGAANNTIIRDNRIHDLGQCQAYDQMIYLSHGDNVQIYDNWMWNDPHGWGVQVYPAATNAHIFDNVIDHAGSGFVVGGNTTVSGNTIEHNIVMNSTGLVNAGLTGVGISTCCGLGPNNSFSSNDVYNNPGGIDSASGITLTANTTTNPSLADPQNHDYRPTTTTPNTITTRNLWNGNLGTDHSAPVGHVASAKRHALNASGAVAGVALARVRTHRVSRTRAHAATRRARTHTATRRTAAHKPATHRKHRRRHHAARSR